MASGSTGKTYLQVNKAKARENFLTALEQATSGGPLPEEWVERSRQVGRSSSMTHTPILGTALLAKATNRDVDALALQRNIHRGYSARGLAKEVLVPLCVEHGIDLRTKGAEPLNNQPFFAQPKIIKELVPETDPTARKELEYLIACLEKADFLEGEDAVAALAAFLRVRIEDGDKATLLELEAGQLGLYELAQLSTEFINVNREGGRRGQAFVAACLDVMFPGKVRADAINDPSRRVPGDVAVEAAVTSSGDTIGAADIAARPSAGIVLSAEAKQKPVTPSEVLQFVERLAAAGIDKGVYAALDPNQPDLGTRVLSQKSLERNGVLLQIVTEPRELLELAIQWSPKPIRESLHEFPQLLVLRLKDFHCGRNSQEEWAEMLAQEFPQK
ncbi:restriction endonuclease, SacI family [Streptomonospora sp. PA3]|uniref:restriction endonuclease, SacI family n=1 Tax=Streptomonospora sp. PA3 TaxID=2607326 RepID=UPI0012DC787B|nr:restriction endonuclease, SacI family [Streptomonospora sp. PA3]MUL41634.1 restriction endonuclease, SacI family [Streptomonospora sp. PA3]